MNELIKSALKELTPSEMVLYFAIYTNANNGSLYVSVRCVKELCCLSDTTIKLCTKSLEEKGWIKVIRSLDSSNMRLPNVYIPLR